MPPPKPRNVDDSRSETSSVVANQKEKTAPGPTSGSNISKGKRLTSGLNGVGGGNKAPVNGNPPLPVDPPSTTAATVAGDKDPNLPRTEWSSMPLPILRTYRIAHRLPVPAAFNYAHAELTYKSCEAALRAPSVVHFRRRLHERHLQRKKLRDTQQQSHGVSKTGKKERGRSKETTKTEKAQNTSLVIAQSIEPADQNHPENSQNQVHPPLPTSPSSSAISTSLGPREPASHLANAVRKHFNAQQLSEADTIARFIYVVQQNGKQVRTEGSEGDGSGHWMGSHGRQSRRIDGPGGEVGFRLRFRP